MNLPQQLKSAWWLVGYYITMLIISYFGSFGGGKGYLDNPVDLILIAIVSLAIFFWAKYTGLPKAMIDSDDETPEEKVETSH